jgi:hypothetical protein
MLRGKTKDGNWAYGIAYDEKTSKLLMNPTPTKDGQFKCDAVVVIKETVGRKMCITAKDGSDVYEGDIIKDKITAIVRYGRARIMDNEWYNDNEVCGFYLERLPDREYYHPDYVATGKIIGNIFDKEVESEK